MHAEVTVPMKASPEATWALVSDVTRIGEFSPETFEAQWLDGATGPAVGVTFRGHVKRNGRGPIYWTTCRITHCEPGRDFGFQVLGAGKVVNNWRYRIEPTATGVDVTESFRMQPSLATRLYWAVAGRLRGPKNVEGMRHTLERIRDVLEA